jgi:hypothetical protein
MARLKIALLPAAVAVLCFAAGTASAQPRPYNAPQYGVGYHPPLSPYLDLLRGGNIASNYFLGTIPEIERRQNAQLFQTELFKLDQKISQETVELGIADPIGTTGHVTAFGNTGGYFGSLTGRPGPPPAQQARPVPGRPRR